MAPKKTGKKSEDSRMAPSGLTHSTETIIPRRGDREPLDSTTAPVVPPSAPMTGVRPGTLPGRSLPSRADSHSDLSGVERGELGTPATGLLNTLFEGPEGGAGTTMTRIALNAPEMLDENAAASVPPASDP